MQRPGVDYEDICSLILGAIIFWYLISLIIDERLDMSLMNVVTCHLYCLFDSDIYIKFLKGLKMPKACNSSSKEIYWIKLYKSLYGLKQPRRM